MQSSLKTIIVIMYFMTSFVFSANSNIYDNLTTLGNYNAGNLFVEERAAYIASMNAYSSVANISFIESQIARDSHILWASLNNEESGDSLGWASPPDVSALLRFFDA